MTEKKFDLHCHSTFSDGSKTPKELIDLAKENNLSGISITDHDTARSYTENLFKYARDKNIILIPGVEISTTFENFTIHVLAYGYDVKDLEFFKFLEAIQEKRHLRNLKIIEKLQEHKIDISEEKINQFAKKKRVEFNASIGRPLIALYLYEKGYVASYKNAFDEFLQDGGECFVRWEKFKILEIIEYIHKAGAMAVLAHPFLVRNKKVLKNLIKLPFDGIEDNSKHFSLFQKSILKNCKERGLIITKGSDYHGLVRPNVDLGSRYVTEDVVKKLYDKL